MTRTIRLAELIGALSHALDLTEGQPHGHCIRACWIGMHIGKAINISAQERSDLYYTLLLKDLGCSSNAARICQLYLTDDHSFKSDFKLIDGSLPQALRFVLSHPLDRSAAKPVRSKFDRANRVGSSWKARGNPDCWQTRWHIMCHRAAACADHWLTV